MMVVAVETEGELTFASPTQLFIADQYLIHTGANYRRSYDLRDGRFLMAELEAASSIVVVQNWFEELERLVPTD